MSFPVSEYLHPDGTPRAGAPMGMLLSAQAARQGPATALVIGDQALTFAEVDTAANRMARLLAAQGVAQGDKVLICMPNRLEFILAFYGAWKLGAMPCPVSYRLVASELAEIVDLLEPRCIAADRSVKLAPGSFVDVDAVRLADFAGDPLPPAIAAQGKVIASGGSTGRPKLTVDPVPSVWGPDKASTFRPAGITTLNGGPLYHTMPYNYCILPLAEGSKTVCMRHFDPVEWLRLAEVHRPHSV
ncbi:MAG TPA: AMP-binding protein, partial [Novosphingobium sp.]